MTATLTARLRRLWLDVHLWIGVGLMIVLIPLSASGAWLVWKDSLERMMHADRYAVSGAEVSLPAGRYLAAAREAFDGRATFTQLRFPEQPGDPVVVVGRLNEATAPGARPRNLNVWIDPPTARVLGMADTSTSFNQWMHRLHGTLLIPEIGRKVVGWLGWALFLSSATGLWLWWPRSGAILKALRWRRGPSTLFNLHHMVGFWICLPLAVLSLTGVYISFPQTSRAVFGVAEAEAPRGQPSGPAGSRNAGSGRPAANDRFAPPLASPRLSLDQALATARPQITGEIVSVAAPTVGRESVWRIQVREPGAGTPVAWKVQDADGTVERDRPRAAGDPVSRWMRKIHDGNGTGPVWQTIVFLGGIAPVLLSITGLIMWLRRRARRRALHRPAGA